MYNIRKTRKPKLQFPVWSVTLCIPGKVIRAGDFDSRISAERFVKSALRKMKRRNRYALDLQGY